MYTTAAGTQQKAGIEALQAAAKEQGLKSTTYTATQLIAKQDFAYLIQSAVNLARAKLAPKSPLFART
jgi:hypothetical protein